MMQIRKHASRWIKDQSGATAVEAALCLPMIFMLAFGIFEYGIYYNKATDLSDRFQSASRQIKLLESPGRDELLVVYQEALGEHLEIVSLDVNRVDRYGESFAEVSMEFEHVINIPLLDRYPLTSNYQNLVMLSNRLEG